MSGHPAAEPPTTTEPRTTTWFVRAKGESKLVLTTAYDAWMAALVAAFVTRGRLPR